MLNITFDGDTMSAVYCDSNEAIAEAKRFFKKKIAYLSPDGGLAFSVNVQTLALTMQYITGEPIKR